MSDETIYGGFIDWLNRTWFSLPETEELTSLVKARYTPDEAALLTGMPFTSTNLEELARMKQMDPAELGERLDALSRKGVVYRRVKHDEVRYRLNDAFFVFLRSAFWPGRADEESIAIAPLANRYYYNGFFDQWADVHHQGLRAVPIEGTIEDTRHVMPYEDVVKVVESQDYFSVSHCPCRHRKNIDPNSPDCKYPTEVCLHFGTLGRYTVENGMGREITREEMLETLCNCAEAGLVHGVSNWQDRVDTICNCCKCCCLWFEAFHVLKHSMSVDPSNYQLRVNPETCKGCGLCVKRCPMEALCLEESPEANNKTGKVVVLDLHLCIGCGVCAYKCPTNSLVLERREQTQEPPKDAREWMAHFVADRQPARER